MLRFLFLRFLPRRLIPLLTLYEIYRLIRWLQTSRRPQRPRRLVVSGTATDVTRMTPREVDGQVYGG